MYGRSACHLCDDMWDALEALQKDYNFVLEFRDIDSNPDWHKRYALKIPVLLSGKHEICHFCLDMEAFQRHFSDRPDTL